jgi:Double-GTPase 2
VAGRDRGAACTEFHNLARRLSRVIGERRVGVIWAKSDVELRPEFERRVQEPLAEWFPGAKHFAVSIKASEPVENPDFGFQQVLSWVLEDRPGSARPAIPVFSPADPFLSCRGHRP